MEKTKQNVQVPSVEKKHDVPNMENQVEANGSFTVLGETSKIPPAQLEQDTRFMEMAIELAQSELAQSEYVLFLFDLFSHWFMLVAENEDHDPPFPILR